MEQSRGRGPQFTSSIALRFADRKVDRVRVLEGSFVVYHVHRGGESGRHMDCPHRDCVVKDVMES